MKVAFSMVCIALVVSTAGAQGLPDLVLGKVWSETVLSNPERTGAQSGRGLVPMPKTAFSFEDGAYRSVLSRVKLKLPRLGSETHVSVREAVISSRPDGSIVTSHLVFLPDSMGMVSPPEPGVSALVVTRLRDDRPKDRESIFKSWEPQTPEQTRQYESRGMFHRRVVTPEKEIALERLIENRVFHEPFPYQNRVANGFIKTIGITRFLVIEGDSLLEFSQVVPCAGRALADCKAEAIKISDRFVDGVVEFLVYPKHEKTSEEKK